jgi:hypothetical protein
VQDHDVLVEGCDLSANRADIASGEFKAVFGEPTAEDVALANAHLDGIPAAGSPGPALLTEIINKPIEEMRAAKAATEADLEIPAELKRERTPEETTHIEKHAKAVSSERELVVRKGGAPKDERKPTKIAAVIEKAKTTGITMAQVRETTGRLDQDRRFLRRHQARRADAHQGRRRRLSRRVTEPTLSH